MAASDQAQGRPAILYLDGWAGREAIRVEVVGETPKRYRIRLLSDERLPSRRQGRAGDLVLVPKYAIKILDDGQASGER